MRAVPWGVSAIGATSLFSTRATGKYSCAAEQETVLWYIVNGNRQGASPAVDTYGYRYITGESDGCR